MYSHLIYISTNLDTEKQINLYQFHIQKRLNIFPKDNNAIKVFQLLSKCPNVTRKCCIILLQNLFV